LLPFRYNIYVENNTIISWKINTKCEENLLFMLYTLTYKNYTNNLTPDLVMNIQKFL